MDEYGVTVPRVVDEYGVTVPRVVDEYGVTGASLLLLVRVTDSCRREAFHLL